MFGPRKDKSNPADKGSAPSVAVHVESRMDANRALLERIEHAIQPRVGLMLTDPVTSLPEVDAVFALYPELDTLDDLARLVRAQRAQRVDGRPVLIVGLSPDRLTLFGGWLVHAAANGDIDGLRLIVDRDPNVLVSQLDAYLDAVHEASVVAVPVTGDAERPRYRYFFCLSPQLRAAMTYIAELAENDVDRICLIGAPGVGKSAMAYFYYLCRARGQFVKTNLAAEARHDGTALRSLLCGRVTDTQSGSGALSRARDGVCFLDAFGGVADLLADVLDEALDSHEYQPYGAVAKQPLDCAIVLATTPHSDSPAVAMPYELHMRFAAQPVYLPDLRERHEDLVATVAATLENMRARSSTWQAPAGLTHAAWQALCNGRWHGNLRSLVRVVETAFITSATARTPLIERDAIDNALALWEPRGQTEAAP